MSWNCPCHHCPSRPRYRHRHPLQSSPPATNEETACTLAEMEWGRHDSSDVNQGNHVPRVLATNRAGTPEPDHKCHCCWVRHNALEVRRDHWSASSIEASPKWLGCLLHHRSTKAATYLPHAIVGGMLGSQISKYLNVLSYFIWDDYISKCCGKEYGHGWTCIESGGRLIWISNFFHHVAG
jgi:hypothetical protein